MRFIQAVIFLAFLGAVGLFAVQNTEAITVDFWTWRVTGPVALLAIAAYLLRMMSGWTVVNDPIPEGRGLDLYSPASWFSDP
jgi:lipopolysaccharide assembly protein A